jgi:hypothetical protein
MYYRIADLNVEMTVSGRTAQHGAAYAEPDWEGVPDMEVSCDPEQMLTDCPFLKTLDMAEYMGTGAAFARNLLDFDGFQLHASAVEYRGRAYLFSAPCGTGVSTHAEKWVRLFGARYLNDDKPALRWEDGTWYAYGTPWSGKLALSSNQGAPVGGIAFLQRGEEDRVTRMRPYQALPLVLEQSKRALSVVQTERLLELAEQVLQDVPLWKLVCRDDDQAAILARNSMVNGDLALQCG